MLLTRQIADEHVPCVSHHRRIDVLVAAHHFLYRVDVRPTLVRERSCSNPGLARIRPDVRGLVDKLESSAVATAIRQESTPFSFSCTIGMMLVKLQLPVRSPCPFIVPWTCEAPASIAAMAFATPGRCRRACEFPGVRATGRVRGG
jgi:hypothetical protein